MEKTITDFTGKTIENWKCGTPYSKEYGKSSKKKVYPCICTKCGNKREIPSSDLNCKRNLQCKICNDKFHSYEYDNLTGTRQGSFLIGKSFRKDGRTYYHVKCDCGKKYDILRDNLIRKNYQNCKCHGLAVDIHKTYGLLIPLRRMDDGTWECRCECNNITYVTPSDLINGNTKSCGCKRQANKVKKRSDNTSGIKGISYNKRKNKWIAYINKDGKRTYLGYYENKNLAAEARETAERELFQINDDKSESSREEETDA